MSDLGLSAHDHGNCELCDALEADLAAVIRERDILYESQIKLEEIQAELARLCELAEVGSLAVTLLRSAYLFKGYGHGPLETDAKAIKAVLSDWTALDQPEAGQDARDALKGDIGPGGSLLKTVLKDADALMIFKNRVAAHSGLLGLIPEIEDAFAALPEHLRRAVGEQP